jgi:hypothetical protein
MQNTPDTPRTNPDATLTSLAYINVTWSESKTSYVDNFVPYALEILRLASAPRTANEISREILERFGLNFPVEVTKSLIDRAVRTNQVTRSPHSNAVELAPGVAAGLPDIAREQADCGRRQNELVASLVKFASARFDIAWDETSAEEALVNYIDAHAIPLLASTVRAGAFQGGESLQGSGYIVAAFIGQLSEKDAKSFEFVDQMIKGSMLASALYVESAGQVQRKFRRTTLYLDTSICLQALGHEGDEARTATREMLTLALSQDAELACFRHTVKEIRGILDGVKGVLRRSPGAQSAPRGVAKHFRAMAMTSGDVDLAMATLDDDLARLRIRIVSTPDYSDVLSVDEAALEEKMQSSVGYQFRSTLVSDLHSLTAIHRLRRGSCGPHLEDCRAVFVTDNRNLVQASRHFFNSGRHEFPLAIVGHSLATLLWVKAPNLAPDLPRRRMIADCYAALSPTPAMWIKFSDEVERLTQRGTFTEEQVSMLRYSYEAEQALMDVTLGDPRKLTETSVRETLERARETIARPVVQELDQALDRAVSAENAETQARFVAEQNAAEARRLEARVATLEASAERRRARVRAKITKQMSVLSAAVKVLAIALVSFAVATAVDTFVPDLQFTDRLPGVFPALVRAAAAACFLLGLATLLRGGSVFEWIDGKRDAAIERAIRGIDEDDLSLPVQD